MIKLKKKKILIPLLIASCSLALLSCGGSSKSKNKNNESIESSQNEASNNPDSKTHKVNFIVDGVIVGSVDYQEGQQSILPFQVPEKAGYVGVWDDFELSDKDIYVTARYFKNNVRYKVEYYLENVSDSNFTLQENETQEFEITSGSEVTPRIKTFDHFTCENADLSATVKEDGSTVLKLYYVRDTYTVNFITNNSMQVESKTVKYGTILQEPNLTKPGYTLKGYKLNNKDFDFNTPIVENSTIEAIFSANDIGYKVEYYKENLDNDDYTLEKELILNSKADTEVSAELLEYEGFDFNELKSNIKEEINPDGSTILKVYYSRKRFNVNYVTNTSDVIQPETVKYGAKLEAKTLTKQGYDFKGFTFDDENLFDFNNPVYSDLTLTASFEAKNVYYYINYYQQNLDNDDYSLVTEDKYIGYGKTGTKIVIDKLYQGFTLDETISDLEGIVKPDGSTTLNVYYNRKQFEVNFITNNGTELESLVVKYGAKIQEPQLTKDGYTYSCFKSNNVDFNFNNPVTTNLTLEAYFIPNDSTKYTVEYYLENIYDDGYTYDASSTYYGQTDSIVNVNPDSHHYNDVFGFEVSNPNQTATIAGDGSTVIKIYYKRVKYQINYYLDDEVYLSKEIKYHTFVRDIVLDTEKNGYTLRQQSNRYGNITKDLNDAYWVQQDDDIILIFTPKEVKCQVEYYLEDLDGSGYTKSLDYSYEGLYYCDDEIITSDYAVDIEGFTFYEEMSTGKTTAMWDDSTVLKLYYKRKYYTVNFVTNIDGVTLDSLECKYGTKLDKPQLSKTGYSLVKYSDQLNYDFDFDKNIVNKDLTLTAEWSANKVKYKVEYYLQSITSDEYELDTENSYEDTYYSDYEITIPANNITGFTYKSQQSNTHGYINPDGTSVYKLYYDRKEYTVRFGGYASEIESYDVRYGSLIEEPKVTRVGYTLSHWTNQYNQVFNFNSSTITSDTSLTPFFVANTDTSFILKTYLQHIDDDEYDVSEVGLTATTDEYFSSTGLLPEYTGFYVQGYNDDRISGDGSTIIEVYYYRYTYDFRIEYNSSLADLGEGYTGYNVRYGKTININIVDKQSIAYTYMGYNIDEEHYSERNISLTVDKNYYIEIEYELKDELNDFNFYVDEDNRLFIQGLSEEHRFEDTIYIPDYAYGISDYAFNGYDGIKRIIFGNNLEYVGVQSFNSSYFDEIVFNSKLKTIDNDAFGGCECITSFTVPSTLESIGNYAFYNTNINTLNYDDNPTLKYIGEYAFYDTNIESLYIPNSVIKIDNYAFQNCPITNISFEENSNLETIGKYAFYKKKDDNGLVFEAFELELPNSLTTIDNYAFANLNIDSVIISNSITSIGYYAFYNCPIENISFESGSSLESIGDYAFSISNNENRTHSYDLIIPNSVTSIGSYAFYNTNISSVSFEYGTTIETISSYSFANSLVESVTIPRSVTTVDNCAFNNCPLKNISFEQNSNLEYIGTCAFNALLNTDISNLNRLVIPRSVKTIGDFAFRNYLFDELVFESDSNLETIGNYAIDLENEINDYLISDIILPNKLTNIGSGVFKYRFIKSVSFDKESTIDSIPEYAFYEVKINDTFIVPETVTKICDWAFYGARLKNGITLPDSLESIGDNAFNGTYLYCDIAIPKNVTFIGDDAFYYAKLNSLTFAEDSIITKIGNRAFRDASISKLILPNSLIEIGEEAFYQNNIKTLVLPDNLEIIGNKAFGYSNISSIVINKSLYEIGDSAFYGNTISYIFMHTDIFTIDEDNLNKYGNLFDDFPNVFDKDYCKNLQVDVDKNMIFYVDNDDITLVKYFGNDKEVTIPLFVDTIAENAFYDNKYIETLIILDNTSTIIQNAFSNCTNLKFVALGKKVSDIGYSAFEGTNIRAIENNSALELEIGSSDNGQIAKNAIEFVNDITLCEYIIEDYYDLYTNGNDVYILNANCYSAEEFVIPSEVTIIGNGAFSSANYDKIIIPNTIRIIKTHAFESYKGEIEFEENSTLEFIEESAFGYANMDSIYIPGSVMEITDGVFAYSIFNRVELGEGITKICEDAFSKSKCGELILPESLQLIENQTNEDIYIYEIYNKSSLEIFKFDDVNNGGIAKNTVHVYTEEGNSKIYIDGDYLLLDDGFDIYALAYYGDNTVITTPENATILSQNLYTNKVYDEITIRSCVRLVNNNLECVISVIFEEDSVVEDFPAYYPSYYLEKIVMPDNLTVLNNWWNPYNLVKVIFRESSNITEISASALGAAAYSEDLIVTLPTTIQKIGYNAIYSQYYDAYIFYYGTETEWASVDYEENQYYEIHIYFYSEEENLDGKHWHLDEDGNPVIWETE